MDVIMDIINCSMPTTGKNKIIEQGLNYVDSTVKEMTDLFETGVENLEPREDKNKSSASSRQKNQEKKSNKKTKQDYSL